MKTDRENGKEKRRRAWLCAAVCLFLSVFLAASAKAEKETGGIGPAADAALAARIAPRILRFHVLANSDSPEDQALKFEVRDLLLSEIAALSEDRNMRQEIPADGSESGSEDTSARQDRLSRGELCALILKNRAALESHAEALAASRGFSYPVAIRLERCEFPERTYGDLTFPAGTYDAVRVLIGRGDGKNYWCVLYPSLCYLDCTHAVVPGESKELLRDILPEDDFYALLSARRNGADASDAHLPRIEIRFKFLEILKRRPSTTGSGSP